MPATIQILDGGLGTSLEDSYGLKFTHATPLWSSHLITSDPDTLRACQRDFAAAGADVLLTATYQASIEGFAQTATADFPAGVPREGVGRYLQTAVDVAAAAAADARAGARVALSLGPYGACMIPGQEYSGRYDAAHAGEEALYRWHLERLRLFAAVDGLLARVQYVAFETLPRLDEVRAVRRAVADVPGLAGVPFWIACVYPGVGDAARLLPDGSSVDAVLEAMLGPAAGAATPWGVGINCTKLPKLAGLVRDYEAAWARVAAPSSSSTAPVLVLYPDGTQGEVYNTTTSTWEKPEGQTTTPHDPQESWAVQLAGIVRESQARGVFSSFLVGGCCKAAAADIKSLREELLP